MNDRIVLNPLHSKATPEWYTPKAYVEAAREVMGAIDLDPASCAKANETVKAAKFFTREDNGLQLRWHGRVFVNPPGGLVKDFWRMLLVQMEVGNVVEAIWIGYSLQQLQTLQTGQPGPIKEANALCFPRKRIAFVDANGVPSRAPTHANYIAYFGRHADTFAIHFAQFGERITR